MFMTFSRLRFFLVWLVYRLQLCAATKSRWIQKIHGRKLAITEILAKLAIKMNRDKPAMKIDIQVIYAGALFAIFYLLPHVAAVFASCWCIVCKDTFTAALFFLLHADAQMQTFAARWCIVCTFTFLVTRWCINYLYYLPLQLLRHFCAVLTDPPFFFDYLYLFAATMTAALLCRANGSTFFFCCTLMHKCKLLPHAGVLFAHSLFLLHAGALIIRIYLALQLLRHFCAKLTDPLFFFSFVFICRYNFCGTLVPC